MASEHTAADADVRKHVLEARDLRVERGGETIFEDVSLTVPAGTRLLIQGVSGAGKTTLFEVLGLLTPPSDGSLFVEGQDAAALSERLRARLRREAIGIVFQDFQLVPDLTAWENAALPQEHAGDRDEEWLETLFDRLGIADRREQYPATLSGGEKQRVAIARSLANRPDVILADEPTGQLDLATADRVMDLLFDLHEETNVALVVVSHDPRLEDRFERVVQIADGTVVEDSSGTPPSTQNSATE